MGTGLVVMANGLALGLWAVIPGALLAGPPCPVGGPALYLVDMASAGRGSTVGVADRGRAGPSGRGRGAVLGGWDDRLLRASPSVLRIGAGLLWLSNVGWKVPPDFGRSGQGCRGLCAFVNQGVDHGVVAPWRWVLEEVVSPNLGLFGWVTLVVEFALAATLLSGRFTPVAALVGIGQSMMIGLSVANAPDEWYWSYALMVLVHLAVFATASRRESPLARPALVAMSVVAYGALVAIANARNDVFTSERTRDWLLVGGTTDFPGDFGRNVLAGSVALGVVVAAAGVVSRRVAGAGAARWVGGGLLAAAALLLLAYDDGGNLLGATPAALAVAAALGLWLVATTTTNAARPTDA